MLKLLEHASVLVEHDAEPAKQLQENAVDTSQELVERCLAVGCSFLFSFLVFFFSGGGTLFWLALK